LLAASRDLKTLPDRMLVMCFLKPVKKVCLALALQAP
jgi:hypothetical protein